MNDLFDHNEEITPDSMVILSFTNKDANRLKDRALKCLFPTSNIDILTTQFWNNQIVDTDSTDIMRREISNKLWAGTMHSFSLAILNKYSQNQSSSSKLRVLPAREMRNRVSASLRTLLNEKSSSNSNIRLIQDRHLLALNDVGQSRSILYQNIVRCIELWKEANVPLVPPEIVPLSVIQPTGGAESGSRSSLEEDEEKQENQHREVQIRKSCMELAMRLGIPKSSALLALDIFGEYQSKHAAAGTADPSDLASMAYRLLVDQPNTLHSLRSKLKHLIVDEYQDMSVSQHALLRLVVRGDVHDDNHGGSISSRVSHKKKKAEQRRRRKLPVLLEPGTGDKRTFKASTSSTRSKGLSVPNIFCAGDASQSIYGWRGGAPELTVHGFRRDYPQGVIAPLSTCYRLPNDIVEAAAMLLPQGNMNEGGTVEFMDESDVSDSYDVSPAAAAKLASSIIERQPSNGGDVKGGRNPQRTSEDKVRLGNRLLLSKAMQKLDSTVLLHGLWDDREEAKYIASTIRRRSKERRKALINALSDIDEEVQLSPTEKDFLDLTEVVVMARTSNKLHLVKEALTNAGIPFVSSDEGDIQKKEEESANSWLSQKRSKSVKTLPMKPVIVSTMHRSKGEEFDDVYLAGWTEGEFPHPDAVSSNRVHEERRLAYVALTRARQRVVITHSFMKRVLHYGRNGMKKYVTSQVEPSRFLYELVPSKRIEDGAVEGDEKNDENEPPWLPSSSDNKGTTWKRSSGIKEYIVGKNAPDFFQKAYQKPKGYVAKRSELRRDSSIQLTPEKSIEESIETPPTSKSKQEVNISQKTPLDIVAEGLRDIVGLRKKGASKKYTPIFKEMLASFFQIKRGKALVFKSDARGKQTQNESVYALIEAKPDDLMKKPLGKCTATQLGHYLAYLVLSKKEDEEATNEEVASNDKVETINWADLPIKKLKPELKKRGLKVSGKKKDLVQRLVYDDQQRRIDNM